jgi:hypothetical protein
VGLTIFLINIAISEAVKAEKYSKEGRACVAEMLATCVEIQNRMGQKPQRPSAPLLNELSVDQLRAHYKRQDKKYKQYKRKTNWHLFITDSIMLFVKHILRS